MPVTLEPPKERTEENPLAQPPSPEQEHDDAYPGAVLIVGTLGVVVLGFSVLVYTLLSARA